ncbi:MAG: hypothetical protein UZ17_ACD001000864 [Acidobacteria bacterium OLB17]|nr:MAG: hypothetical protein UZ17_ACD001000864 [Acidobacteria bacterium OLB17]
MNVVRPKTNKPGRRAVAVNLAAAAVVCAVVLGGFFAWYAGFISVFAPKNEIVETAAGRIIKVPSGGDLQGAIDKARSGDVIELEAGGVYAGRIDLTEKPLTDYVTIRSSRAAELPEGKRVTPDQKPMLATIKSGMLGRAAIYASNGAHHYRFVGIEFVPSSSIYNYGLIVLGGDETRPERVPHDLEIDRCYIHSIPTGKTRRGIALNSARTVIKNSYIEGFAGKSDESQGICGWSGTRDVKVLNNYIEGGAENVMFGGSDPANAELIPTNIEVVGNYLNKPEAWKQNKFTVKTLFELKNARHVRFADNFLSNNWEGSAFRITVRNQDGGAPFSTIEDVEITGNTIVGAGEGINILGSDDTYPSQMLKRLTIKNNLFLDLGGPGFEGSGYFIQVASGDTITISNNTVFNRGNIITFYGDLPRNFAFSSNVTGHGLYGVHGPLDINSAAARSMIHGNIFFNNMGVNSGDLSIPPGNQFAESIDRVGFSDREAKDLRLKPGTKYCGNGGECPGISFAFPTTR